jgi:hypothetical protein
MTLERAMSVMGVTVSTWAQGQLQQQEFAEKELIHYLKLAVPQELL